MVVSSLSWSLLSSARVEDNGRPYVDGGSFRLAIPRNLENRYQAMLTNEVVFGIRPEHMSDRSFASDIPGMDELESLVDVIEPIGPEVILIVTAGEHQLTEKIDPHAETAIHKPIQTFNRDFAFSGQV